MPRHGWAHWFPRQSSLAFLTLSLFLSLQNGNTALAIAKRLGYISVVDTLKVVTEEVTTTTTVSTEITDLPLSSWFFPPHAFQPGFAASVWKFFSWMHCGIDSGICNYKCIHQRIRGFRLLLNIIPNKTYQCSFITLEKYPFPVAFFPSPLSLSSSCVWHLLLAERYHILQPTSTWPRGQVGLKRPPD